MSKQNQPVAAQAAHKPQQKPTPAPVAEMSNGVAVAEMEMGGAGLAGGLSLLGQAGQLDESRLSVIQRQKIANQIGQRQGNRQLRKLIGPLRLSQKHENQPTKTVVQTRLSDEQVDTYANRLYVSGFTDGGHSGVRILREHHSDLEQLQQEFLTLPNRVELKDFIKNNYSDDHKVRATALLHDDNYHLPHTQLALCLIPITTRDTEFWRIMESHTFQQRRQIEARYNQVFHEIGNGSLWLDIQDDLSGMEEIKAHIMLHRELTPADHLYLSTAGQYGTNVDMVLQILRTQWAAGASTFESFANRWNPSGLLPDVENGHAPLYQYFQPAELMGFSNPQAIQNNLTIQARSMIYTVLSELSGAARTAVVAIFLEFLEYKSPNRKGSEATLETANSDFTERERSDLAIAHAALDASESFDTDEDEFYRAVRQIGEIYRSRIERLRHAHVEPTFIEQAQREWIEAQARIERDHIQEEMDTDYEVMRARLSLVGMDDADRIYLNCNDYDELMNVVERVFRQGRIDTIIEQAGRAKSTSTGQEIRPAYDLTTLVSATRGDDASRFHLITRQDRNDAERGGHRIRFELQQGVDDDVMDHLNRFLLHNDWSGNLHNDVLESYRSHFLHPSSMPANVALVAHLRTRGFAETRGFARLRDQLDPARTARGRSSRAEEDREAEHSGFFAPISDAAVSVYNDLTGEDSMQIVDESIDRLRVFGGQAGASQAELDAFQAIYGRGTDLSDLEYRQFQERLQDLRDARATVREFAGTVVSLTVQAALTVLTAGAGATLIASTIARQIAIAAASEMAGMVTREALDSRGYDLASADNVQQMIVTIAGAGAGALVESETRLAALIDDVAQSQLARSALREGFSQAVEQGTATMIRGMRGQLDTTQLQDAVVKILAGAASAGISNEQIRTQLRTRFSSLQSISDDFLEDLIQNVTSGLTQESVAIAGSATTVRGLDGTVIVERLATSIATSTRDAAISHTGRMGGGVARRSTEGRHRRRDDEHPHTYSPRDGDSNTHVGVAEHDQMSALGDSITTTHDNAHPAVATVQFQDGVHEIGIAGTGPRRGYYLCSAHCALLEHKLDALLEVLPRGFPDRRTWDSLRNLRSHARRESNALRRGIITAGEAEEASVSLADELRRLVQNQPQLQGMLSMAPEDLRTAWEAERPRAVIHSTEFAETHGTVVIRSEGQVGVPPRERPGLERAYPSGSAVGLPGYVRFHVEGISAIGDELNIVYAPENFNISETARIENQIRSWRDEIRVTGGELYYEIVARCHVRGEFEGVTIKVLDEITWKLERRLPGTDEIKVLFDYTGRPPSLPQE